MENSPGPWKDEAQRVAFNSVLQERNDQDKTFGEQVHDPAYWLAIMAKQVGQLGSAIIRRNWARDIEIRKAADVAVYREASQVAAVAVALMEAVRRGDLVSEITTAVPRQPRQRARALGVDDEDLIRYDKDDVEAQR